MIAIIAILYFATGQLGLMLAVPPGYATIIWPPSGIAIGMLLAYGRRLWPGVFIGSFILNATMAGGIVGLMPEKAAIALAIAAGSTFQAVAAEAFVKRVFGRPVSLESGRHILALFAIAGPIACLIASLTGTATLAAAGIVSISDVKSNWCTWWLGDILGVFVFAPLIMLSPWHDTRIQWRGEPLGTLPAVAILVVLLPLGLTFYAWKASNHHLYKKNHELFSNLALENAAAVFHRLDSYKQSLLGGIGFFKGTAHVSARDWEAYVDALDLDHNFPGVYGIGFIENVASGDKDRFLTSTRAELPGFNIHPEAGNDKNYIIKYISPTRRNKAAAGLNIAFEENRRHAAELSRDTGKPAITRKIRLVQDRGDGHGFLLLNPLYRGGQPLVSISERREALIGWAYAPFSARSFLRELTASQGSSFRLRVYDGRAPSQEGLIFDSHAHHSSGEEQAQYRIEKSREVMQQPWTLVWSSVPAFETSIRSNEPLLILFGGLVTTSLFSALLFAFAHRTETVRRLVDQKTQELAAARKEAVDALVRAEAASESKSAFLAAMSHEIRTPLTTIVGYARLALEGDRDETRRRQDTEVILDAGVSLKRLINDVFDYACIEAGQTSSETTTTRVGHLVESSVAMVWLAAAQKGLTIEVAVPAEVRDLCIWVDEQRLRQVLLNLIDNAVKYTEAGKIQVDVSIESETIETVGLVFRVRDQGIGIAEGDIGQLFMKFSQVRSGRSRPHGGAGLGLAICKGLVEAMGGSIGVESQPGVGSTFQFSIPARKLAKDEVDLQSESLAAVKGGRVLVVDDVDVNRDLAIEVLRRYGFAAVGAASGRDAVQQVASGHFDVVMMDVQMPGYNGLDATRDIRRLQGSSAGVHIIALTAGVSPDEIDECWRAGMDDFIGKPFDWMKLVERIQSRPS